MNQLHETIIKIMSKNTPKDSDSFSKFLRKQLRTLPDNSSVPSKIQLLKAYHTLLSSGKIKTNKKLESLLIKRSIRTMSGVTIVTVLTKPYACPGKCIYCPNEQTMPKSYLPDEPAAARALMLKFNPTLQVTERIAALKMTGHPTDKIELIVKGGTWNAYKINYQYWFILRCFEAANKQKHDKLITEKTSLKNLRRLLLLAQKKNEKAKHRIIGLTLETRPDFINTNTILLMRELGTTRLELGVQSTDDKTLAIIQRGHTTQATKDATTLLKNYGFKVDYHLMPQLPGMTPTADLKMLKKIFEDTDYRPDMIKIYPCTVMRNSPLYSWVKSGKYKPYSNKKLIENLIAFKIIMPRYVRISRLIRDIPSHHIMAGNRITSLRQNIQSEMKIQKLKCNCLRCREIGHILKDDKKNIALTKTKPKLFIDKYEASGGTEYFLSFEDENRKAVFAFCRLRIGGTIYKAYIRELHTYGQALSIGEKNKKLASQHKGMGTKLMKEAEKICKKNKISKLAVISGVGVRGYYRKLGYRLENGYMTKKINTY